MIAATDGVHENQSLGLIEFRLTLSLYDPLDGVRYKSPWLSEYTFKAEGVTKTRNKCIVFINISLDFIIGHFQDLAFHNMDSCIFRQHGLKGCSVPDDGSDLHAFRDKMVDQEATRCS